MNFLLLYISFDIFLLLRLSQLYLIIINFVMKRYILTTISLAIISLLAFGQQQVENPGFEEWEEVGLGPDILEPVDWSTIKTSDDPTLSGLAPVTWERVTESHSGEYAVKLFNVSVLGIAAVGTMCNGRYHPDLDIEVAYSYTDPEDPQWNTPFTSRPDSISFWMKFFPEGDDTLQFKAMLHVDSYSQPPFFNPENRVAIAQKGIGGTFEEWTRISVPFEYDDDRTPEYILIIITSGNNTTPNIGSYAYYDDLEVIYIQSVDDNPLGNTNIYYANGKLMLHNFPVDYLNDASVELVDITGRKLWQDQIYSTEIPINNLKLNSGLYIVRLTSDKYSFSSKLYID